MRSAIAVCVFVALAAAVSGQQPTFRSGVDLIAVDVHVIDRSGAPVVDIPAGQFPVTIDGGPASFRHAGRRSPRRRAAAPGAGRRRCSSRPAAVTTKRAAPTFLRSTS
jgi:hypothetical protein